MAGVAGKTNNPNGRPPKSRALTDLLIKELNKPIEVEGVKVAGKKIVAGLVVKAVTTGRLKFPEDKNESVISVKDWIEFTKWLYSHVDGAPKNGLDEVAENGLKVIVEYANPPSYPPEIPSEPAGDTQ